MYRDMLVRGWNCWVYRVVAMFPERGSGCASAVLVCIVLPRCEALCPAEKDSLCPSRFPSRRPSRRGRLMLRPGTARKLEDAVGDRRILAAEMMASADLRALDVARGELRTDRVALALSVDAQHRRGAEATELGPGRRTPLVASHPVGNPDLERGVGVDPEQAHARHPRAQLRRQPVDDERQHIGAERVADEQHAFLVP